MLSGFRFCCKAMEVGHIGFDYSTGQIRKVEDILPVLKDQVAQAINAGQKVIVATTVSEKSGGGIEGEAVQGAFIDALRTVGFKSVGAGNQHYFHRPGDYGQCPVELWVMFCDSKDASRLVDEVGPAGVPGGG